MTYDQWKTTDPNDRDQDEDQPTELELVYEDLRRAKEDAKDQVKSDAARIAALTLALQEALEYFEERYDIRDGAEGQQLPNEEMRLGQMIDETLYGIRF